VLLNCDESVAAVVSHVVTSASTTATPTSTVSLHESDETLNADLTEQLEEAVTFATTDTEVVAAFPMESSTPLASKETRKINETDEYNYLTTLKISTGTFISTESSLEETVVTVIHPLTSTALVSNSTSVQADTNSTERSAEMSTNLEIKFSEDIKNTNMLQEMKLESSDSPQVTGETSKMYEHLPVLSNRSKDEKVKVKRDAKMEDKEGMKTFKQMYKFVACLLVTIYK
jgi:hypothetical protein